MRKTLSRTISSVLVLCLLIVPLCSSVAAAATKKEVMPLYNNTNDASASMSISDNGKMSINYKYVGTSGITTKAVITTYIEKRTLGLFWKRVDIGTANNEWVDTINNYRYTNSRTYQLSSKGTYRVTVIYKIYGTRGTADEIPYEIKDTY